MEILGPQVPEAISDRVFSLFASQTQEDNSQRMSFPDLGAAYLVFKYQEENEIAELCFEIIKLQPQKENIGKDDLVHFCKRIAQMSEIYVNDFYSFTKLDPRENISKSEFVDNFGLVKQLRFMTLITSLIDGYKNEYLNFEDNS